MTEKGLLKGAPYNSFMGKKSHFAYEKGDTRGELGIFYNEVL